ncbi:MAG: glycine cleavage system protein H [Candidatus Hermodarchaeota archaeon]
MVDELLIAADIDYKFPLDRYYHLNEKMHVWALPLGDNLFQIGVDMFGAKHIGEIIFINIKKLNTTVKQTKTFAKLESGKKPISLASPFTGTIKEQNDALKDNPNLIGKDPYGEGWIITIEADNVEKEAEHPEIYNIGDKVRIEEFMKKELKRYGL